MVFGRMVTPRSGVNRTATIQETTSETAITTNSVTINAPQLVQSVTVNGQHVDVGGGSAILSVFPGDVSVSTPDIARK